MIFLFAIAGLFGLIAILLFIALIRTEIIKKECGAEIPYNMEKEGINPSLHAGAPFKNDTGRVCQQKRKRRPDQNL